MPTYLRLSALLLGCVASSRCVTYNPVIVDTKTPLERDIQGPFERLQRELRLAGTTPADDGANPQRRALLQTVLDRQLHAEQLQPLKQQQIVGEARGGLLEILVSADDANVTQLVQRENELRQRLMKQLIDASPELSAADLPLVQQAFHRSLVQAADPGERIQESDGSWITVK